MIRSYRLLICAGKAAPEHQLLPGKPGCLKWWRRAGPPRLRAERLRATPVCPSRLATPIAPRRCHPVRGVEFEFTGPA